MKILITGGAGYIGSHTVLALLKNSTDVIVVDNLSTSSISVIKALERVSGKALNFYNTDVRDEFKMNNIFQKHKPTGVIHFSGSKSITESNKSPLEYYDNNVTGTIKLLQFMNDHNCKKLLFSSSATVYGNVSPPPFDENSPTAPINTYGRSKLYCEKIIKDWTATDSNISAVSLRYFNPVGADKSGEIGESNRGKPTNLMPLIIKAASGKIKFLEIFGNDYDTNDGTAERDYIHVSDLAEAHIKATTYLQTQSGYETLNIGTGSCFSVLQIVQMFEETNNVKVPYKVIGRREGDIPKSWASTAKCKEKLDWEAKYKLEAMCLDAWNWEQKKTF